jgi:hypothetical protein
LLPLLVPKRNLVIYESRPMPGNNVRSIRG